MVKLQCPARDCDYETVEQETRAHAKELLDIHVRIDHADTAAALHNWSIIYLDINTMVLYVDIAH